MSRGQTYLINIDKICYDKKITLEQLSVKLGFSPAALYKARIRFKAGESKGYSLRVMVALIEAYGEKYVKQYVQN